MLPFRSRTLLGLLTLCATCTLPAEPAKIVDEIDTTRENLRQALAYRDQGAKELAAWNLRKNQLQNLITVATGEQSQLEANLANALPEFESLQAKIALLEKDTMEALETEALLLARVPGFAQTLLNQAATWPPPLRSENANLLHKIETLLAAHADASLTPEKSATLLQNSLDALASSLKFQSSLYHGTTHQTSSDGKERLYSILYIGTAQGYYFSQDLAQSGTIDFDNGAWSWNENPKLLEPLLSFDRILGKDAPADWIQLPFNLDAGN